MILVDDQAGSKDLFPYIKQVTPDCHLCRLDPPFGDCMWVGNGPDGKSLTVGVEYKKFTEILDAITGNGRFAAHQVGGMVEHYDRRYLLIEGRIRTDRNSGVLQQWVGGAWREIYRNGRTFTYREFEHWITTVEEHAGFRIKVTYDEYESARWVVAKYSWYTTKEWDEHSALKQFHVQPPPAMSFAPPSLVRRVAKEFTGIGWEKTFAVERRFPTVRQMVCANESEWREVDGIGKVLASRIVKEITGG